MSTKLNMNSDVRGYNAYAPSFAEDNQQVTLVQNVEQNFPVPLNNSKWIAVFSYEAGTDVWVANNATATLPAGSFASTASQLNPAARYVENGDTLSFITPDASGAQVGVSFYAL
jgi:hypothetical protein